MTSVRLIPRTVKNRTRPRMVRALLAALFLTFAIAPSGVLAEQVPKEIATSQGLFPLDEKGLPE